VEEFCVLVPFEGVADLSSSSPIESPFTDRELEGFSGESPRVVFEDGKRPSFFKQVKEIDEETTVSFSLDGGGILLVHLLQVSLQSRSRATSLAVGSTRKVEPQVEEIDVRNRS
jgi:hypothetical protein